MRNKINYLIVIVVGIFSSSVSFAQIPSPLKDVKVSAMVTIDTSTGIYKYSYSIYNPPTNDGQISRLEVDIAKPLNGQELSAANLVVNKGMKASGGMLLRSFEEELKNRLLDKPVIPVGVQPPFGYPFPGWGADIAATGTVSWGGSEQNLIQPNQTVEGFIITSYGLSGIRDVIAEHAYIEKEEDIPDEVYKEDRLYQYLDSVSKNIAYKGKTIGPTAPPADFNPLGFLNSIINMKHEAFKLGWIKNEGILKSLDAKLDNAKKDIEKGNTRSAKNTLKAFINEVEAQGCESYENCPTGKQLTSEAYGLLKYNAQYLIDHL